MSEFQPNDMSAVSWLHEDHATRELRVRIKRVRNYNDKTRERQKLSKQENHEMGMRGGGMWVWIKIISSEGTPSETSDALL